MKNVDLFKYKVGDHVDIMDGWEEPLESRAKICNRRRVLKGTGTEINYYNEYMVDGIDKIFEESRLRISCNVEPRMPYIQRFK